MPSEWLNVSDITPRIAYTATSGQTKFTVPFVFFDNDDLVVYRNGGALTLGTDFTAVGAEEESGGAVTLIIGATVGDQIMIVRHVAIEQTTHFPPSGPFDISGLNFQISKLVAIDQQLENGQTRSLRLPDSDSTASGELAVETARANRLLGFDSTGAIIYPLGPTFVGGTAKGVAQVDSRATAQVTVFDASVNVVMTGGYSGTGDGGGASYKRGAGSGSFTDGGGVTWSLDLSKGVVNPMWFGALGLGSDNTTAIQAALTAAKGKRLHFPTGNFGISAMLDGTDGNIRVTGDGKSKSILTVLGASVVDPVLKFTDASDVTVERLDFRGNAVTATIGAIQFLCTAGSNVIGNYVVRRNAFSNFKAQYWIRFLTNVTSTSHTRRMRYIRVQDNDWVASTSLAPDFTNVGIPAAMLAFQGSVDNNGSYIDDVIVSGNFADCSGMKCFLNCWAGSRNIKASQNYILNAGSLGINDRGCYATMAYNNHATGDISFAPQDIDITDNTIINARTMAFYGATAIRPNVSSNKITGVVDTTAGSLPYAAISFGQCEDAKANHNELIGNYVGIYMIPTPTSPTMEAVGNRIISTIANAKGVTSLCLGSFANKLKVADNSVILTGTGAIGISAYSQGAGFEYDKVDVIGNRVEAADSGIVMSDTTGGAMRGNALHLQDCHVSGAFATIGIDIGPAATIKTFVSGCSINLANAGTAALGIRFTNCTNVNIDGLTIANRGSGTALAFSASGANGTIRNVSLVGIPRANLPTNGSGHMGFQAPTVTPTGVGSFIQNLSTTFYTAQGSSPNQYTVDGWSSDGSTSWLPKRCLTGT